jgi:hypothetical protein
MILSKTGIAAQIFPRESGYFGFLSTIIVGIRRPPVEL